jgi:putative addiction module component (TIGR02574 family)
MSAILDDLKVRALQLTPPDRDELVRALIESIDGEPEGTPEEIAHAWDEEIARRIADFEAGKTKGVPAEEVFAKIRALIAGHGNR